MTRAGGFGDHRHPGACLKECREPVLRRALTIVNVASMASQRGTAARGDRVPLEGPRRAGGGWMCGPVEVPLTRGDEPGNEYRGSLRWEQGRAPC
jgi:hypothetical protein